MSNAKSYVKPVHSQGFWPLKSTKIIHLPNLMNPTTICSIALLELKVTSSHLGKVLKLVDFTKLSQVTGCFFCPSRICNISTYLHFMVFQTIQNQIFSEILKSDVTPIHWPPNHFFIPTLPTHQTIKMRPFDDESWCLGDVWGVSGECLGLSEGCLGITISAVYGVLMLIHEC